MQYTVYVRPAESSTWTFVGAINPQRNQEGYVGKARPEHMYSSDDRWHAVLFHGLRRRNLLDDSADGGARLEVKVEPRADSNTSPLGAVYAFPYRATRHYVTEPKATSLVEEQLRWTAVSSLAHRGRLVPDPRRRNRPRTCTLSADTPLDTARVPSGRQCLSK